MGFKRPVPANVDASQENNVTKKSGKAGQAPRVGFRPPIITLRT